MTPVLRKTTLTTHIVVSVGWLGAVASFTVLSIAAVVSQQTDLVRGAYVAMNLLGWVLIIPLSLASLTTGLILALGTEWGLIRTYWVLVKFLLTCGATILLLVHQITAVAEAAKRVSQSLPGTRPDLGGLGAQLVGDAGLALVVLIAITTLSVVKPWGRTPYGHRLQRERANSLSANTMCSCPDSGPAPTSSDLGIRILWILGGSILVVAVVHHLVGGGLGGHGH